MLATTAIAGCIGIGGLAALFRLGLPWNLLVAALCGFIAVILVRLLYKQAQSRIILHDDGISAVTAIGEQISIPWSLVTHSGMYLAGKKGKVVYIYAESTDQLFTIPNDYTNFDQLLIEIADRLPLPVVDLHNGTIRDYLRGVLNLDTAESDE